MPEKTYSVSKRKSFFAVGPLAFFVIWISIQQWPSTAEAAAENPNDILVITNKSVPDTSVSQVVARDLFLKVRKAWKNGANVIPVVPADEKLRQDFRSRVLNMNSNDEKRYWENMKIKYGLGKPSEIANNQKAVFSVKNSVTYVYRKDYNAGVTKIICVIPPSGN
ncbi:MAG: hypothetical protein JXX14_17290 [Deltaproteobacteria bacterium]|nr:hypothetical protein [Deltaproteobacteria bacterium]